MNDKNKAQWLSARWAEVAQGGVWQSLYPDGDWIDTISGPASSSSLPRWRVVMPTALKVIDLTPLIDSGLDCEFRVARRQSTPRIGKLEAVRADAGYVYFFCEGVGEYTKCQPRMSPHVHYWAGGNVCPVPEGFVIRVHWQADDTFVGAEYNEYTNGYTTWDWGSITAFRILRVADGYVIGGEE